MRVAMLGLGRMGQAIAGRLLHGSHQVTVWNRSAGKTGDLVARGARAAPSVRAAVHGAEAVLTVLADDPAVRAIALGPEGIATCLPSSAVYADCSTVSPALSAELADVLGNRFVALPVLGAPAAVAAGRATLLAGGEEAAVGRLQPVLAAISERVRRYPAAPMASTAKIASNLLLLSGVVTLAEAFTVGRCGGLSDDQLRELLADSPMVAPGLHNRFEGVLTGRHEPWWSTGLGAKDAHLAVDAARAANSELVVAAAVLRQYARAAESRPEPDDIVAVADLYRDRA